MIKENLLYSKSGEYTFEDKGLYYIGVTDSFLDKFGNVIKITLPKIGQYYTKGEIFASVESETEASEVYMPVGGVIEEINQELLNNPAKIKKIPFYEAWLVKISSNVFNEDIVDLKNYSEYIIDKPQ